MHPAAKFQFERAVHEFAQWRTVDAKVRSPAPAWWWDPALSALRQPDPMPTEWSQILGLPCGSSYAAGAQVFLNSLADQTSLPWPDEFPRKLPPRDRSNRSQQTRGAPGGPTLVSAVERISSP